MTDHAHVQEEEEEEEEACIHFNTTPVRTGLQDVWFTSCWGFCHADQMKATGILIETCADHVHLEAACMPSSPRDDAAANQWWFMMVEHCAALAACSCE